MFLYFCEFSTTFEGERAGGERASSSTYLALLHDGLTLKDAGASPVAESERVGRAHVQQFLGVGSSQHEESRRYRPVLPSGEILPPLRTVLVGHLYHVAFGLNLVALRAGDGRAVEIYQDVIA